MSLRSQHRNSEQGSGNCMKTSQVYKVSNGSKFPAGRSSSIGSMLFSNCSATCSLLQCWLGCGWDTF